MINNEESKITVPFDVFFDVLHLSEVKQEKKRQDLIKAGVIHEINGKEYVLLRKCAKYVFDELGTLYMKAAMSRSVEDIMNYAFTSLGYLRVWSCFLTCIGPSSDTSRDASPIKGLRKELKGALDNYDEIYGHVRTALKISLETNISANTKE